MAIKKSHKHWKSASLHLPTLKLNMKPMKLQKYISSTNIKLNKSRDKLDKLNLTAGSQ